jgi:hypothetical protein
MAANLQKAGYKLVVHDLQRQAASHHLNAGATWADNPRALIVWLLLLFSLSGQVWSQEWKGDLATLWDAQVACSDTNSKDCEPFLAEAVAVADVMKELSTVVWHRPQRVPLER